MRLRLETAQITYLFSVYLFAADTEEDNEDIEETSNNLTEPATTLSSIQNNPAPATTSSSIRNNTPPDVQLIPSPPIVTPPIITPSIVTPSILTSPTVKKPALPVLTKLCQETAAIPPKKKPKTNIPTPPANMKVKVIRACPKCTPIVIELAEQANKASKNSQELKKLMEDATRNVEKVKAILDDTFQKNRQLEANLQVLQDQKLPLVARIVTSDILMRMHCGINMCNQFKWLADKATLRLTSADVLKLKPIKLNFSEQILAVLMFLRSNPTVEELSHTFSFGFTEEQFWDMFAVWLSALCAELKPRIHKPPNCMLNTNFPPCFQSMGRNLQAVIHKFDIIRAKPAVFDANHTSHCLKCIVVMSPKGSVMGVSQVVDQIVENSDLFIGSELDKLFSVANIVIDTQSIGLTEVLPFGVKVVEPPFDSELEDEALDHMEKIVQKLLDYRILQGPIVRTVTKSTMDMVVTLCCGLLNLYQESVLLERGSGSE